MRLRRIGGDHAGGAGSAIGLSVDAAAIEDLFAPLFPIRLKRMFGGLGVYRGETIFAIEALGELYLKVDAQTREAFERAGSRPFVYEKKAGAQSVMSYWLLPASAFDDEGELRRFAGLALAAAERAGRLKPPAPRKARAIRPT